jgi:hypothetical protein
MESVRNVARILMVAPVRVLKKTRRYLPENLESNWPKSDHKNAT